jgi:2-amino-4-hydroxy-6-hydroxymethyldihydropteridine diphosphokinase
MARTSYAIALGSNRRHIRHGGPEGVLRAAIEALGELGDIERVSAIHRTPALGPAGRGFANAALVLTTQLDPAELLSAMKRIERRFGRRPGRRWGPRVLDLDIILWSQGRHEGRRLRIPHPEMARRDFVLRPLREVAAGWRHPIGGARVRQLAARHRRRKV